MTGPLLTEDEVAELLGVPVARLAEWRYKRSGPAFVKVGRQPRYRTEDLDAWLTARTVPTSESAGRAPRLRQVR